MVRVEAVIIAILGAVLGIVDRDRCSAWAMQQALVRPRHLDARRSRSASCVVLLIVAAPARASSPPSCPARRAAKLNMLEAISYE